MLETPFYLNLTSLSIAAYFHLHLRNCFLSQALLINPQRSVFHCCARGNLEDGIIQFFNNSGCRNGELKTILGVRKPKIRIDSSENYTTIDWSAVECPSSPRAHHWLPKQVRKTLKPIFNILINTHSSPLNFETGFGAINVSDEYFEEVEESCVSTRKKVFPQQLVNVNNMTKTVLNYGKFKQGINAEICS